MGSWSESCGFSGIEIGEREYALVAFLGKPRFRDFGGETHYELRTPLLRGTYNDYGYLNVEDDEGIIALFNHLSGLSLKNGDDFADRNEHAVEGLDRFWIREDVHQSLNGLKQDFPYVWRTGRQKSVKVKNIGAALALRIEDLTSAMDEQKALHEKWEGMAGAGMTLKERLELATLLSERPIRNFFGYRADGINWMELCQNIPDGVSREALLEAYRRHSLLLYAASELRKKIVPSESGGPQHGGEQASCQFARAILRIQKERKNRWN